MRSSIVLAASALALAVPATAHANDAGDVWRSSEEGEVAAPIEGDVEPALGELADRLGDPEFQTQATVMAQVLVGTLLDLEIGPLAEALDRATDGRGPDIAPDARVRDLAPDAEELPDQIAEKLPEAMEAMSAMTGGMQDMLPALRDMADKMREAMEGVRGSR